MSKDSYQAHLFYDTVEKSIDHSELLGELREFCLDFGVTVSSFIDRNFWTPFMAEARINNRQPFFSEYTTTLDIIRRCEDEYMRFSTVNDNILKKHQLFSCSIKLLNKYNEYCEVIKKQIVDYKKDYYSVFENGYHQSAVKKILTPEEVQQHKNELTQYIIELQQKINTELVRRRDEEKTNSDKLEEARENLRKYCRKRVSAEEQKDRHEAKAKRDATIEVLVSEMKRLIK